MLQRSSPSNLVQQTGGGEIVNAYLSSALLRLLSQLFDLAICEQLQRSPVGNPDIFHMFHVCLVALIWVSGYHVWTDLCMGFVHKDYLYCALIYYIFGILCCP